ncbi:hypothetical protein PSPO01_15614 [Paraphaeosphaeria sporulosa]
MQLNTIIKDFLVAVNKVAPIWATAFQDYSRYAAGMTRKEIIKRFQEYIMVNHPSAKSKHKVAFITNGAFLTNSSETT